VLGVTRFEAVAQGKDGRVERSYPVLATPRAPIPIDARMFSSVGDLGQSYVYGLGVVAIVFLLLEVAALVTGVVMTAASLRRRWTLQSDAVVQSGDFSTV